MRTDLVILNQQNVSFHIIERREQGDGAGDQSTAMKTNLAW